MIIDLYLITNRETFAFHSIDSFMDSYICFSSFKLVSILSLSSSCCSWVGPLGPVWEMSMQTMFGLCSFSMVFWLMLYFYLLLFLFKVLFWDDFLSVFRKVESSLDWISVMMESSAIRPLSLALSSPRPMLLRFWRSLSCVDGLAFDVELFEFMLSAYFLDVLFESRRYYLLEFLVAVGRWPTPVT